MVVFISFDVDSVVWSIAVGSCLSRSLAAEDEFFNVEVGLPDTPGIDTATSPALMAPVTLMAEISCSILFMLQAFAKLPWSLDPQLTHRGVL